MMKKFFRKKTIKYLLIFDAVMIIVVSGAVAAEPSPSHVQALSIATSTFDTVDLTWEPSEAAEGYRVYRSSNGKDYDFIASTTETSFKDEGLRTGTRYYYRIEARNGLTVSGIKDAMSVGVTPKLVQPKLYSDTSKGDIELKFDKIEGAAGYEILRNGDPLKVVTETTFIDSEAEPDKVYEYKVRAVRYSEDPVYSAPSNATSVELHSIPDFAVEATQDNILIEWGQSEYYSHYKLYNGDELLEESDDLDFVMDEYELSKAYDLKLVGYSEDGKIQSPVLKRKIKVEEEPMDNEGARQAACDWGVMIAADNSFAYGAGDTAHRTGCYFCGTNIGKKGRAYEKTYCCNPFVHACYAHGAGDPQMLSTCRRGGSVGMKSGDYTRYGNWINIGKPSYSSLQKGDVFIYEGHVMLFIGDDLIVHAAAEGWGANTIREDDARVWYDSDIRFVMRYTGTGSGTMYKVKYLDDNGEVIEIESDNSEDSEEVEDA